MTRATFSAEQPFVFAVPLKPEAQCADWVQAQANLRRTIRSARHASAGHRMLLCVACHDEPSLDDVAGDDIVVLRVPFPEPETYLAGGRDKSRKRRFIGAWLRETISRDADVYVMFLDADDLPRKGLVHYIVEGGAASYLVDSGYIIDLASGLLHRRTKGFHHTCGSSFVCRFSRDELPTRWEDVAVPYSQFGTSPEQYGHQDYDKAAIELGRPPTWVPFPAVAYAVNHGESLWAMETGGGRRHLRYPRDLVAPSQARRLLADDFAAPDLAEQMAGRTRAAWECTKVSATLIRKGCTRAISRHRASTG